MNKAILHLGIVWVSISAAAIFGAAPPELGRESEGGKEAL